MRTTSNCFMVSHVPVWFSLVVGFSLILGCEPRVETLAQHAPPQGKVTLGVIHQGGGVRDDGTLTLVGEHHELEFTMLYVVVADIELHACDATRGSAAALDWLIPTAYAHVPDSATRLGTPTLHDLGGEPGRARILGEVAPPPGEYCALRVILAPADEDVVNLSMLAPEEVTGYSAILKGRWREVSQGSWHSFSYHVEEPMVWRVALPDVIRIDAEHDSAFVLVQSTLDGDLADRLGDWIKERADDQLDDAALGAQILQLVGDTQQRYTSPSRAVPP